MRRHLWVPAEPGYATISRWRGLRHLVPAHHVVARGVHEVIVLLDHDTLLIATVEAHLFEPVRQRAEYSQLLRREHVPGRYQPGHDGVVGLADVQSEVSVGVDQQLTVGPARLLGGRVNHSGDPLPATVDRCNVYGRVSLAAVVLVVRHRRVPHIPLRVLERVVDVPREPDHRGAVPAWVHPVRARPVPWDVERLDHHHALGDRVDRADTVTGDTRLTRLQLPRRDAGENFLLLRFGYMRDVVHVKEHGRAAHVNSARKRYSRARSSPSNESPSLPIPKLHSEHNQPRNLPVLWSWSSANVFLVGAKPQHSHMTGVSRVGDGRFFNFHIDRSLVSF